jgi:hypothetical protein
MSLNTLSWNNNSFRRDCVAVFFNQSTKFEVHFTVTEDLDIRYIKILNNSLRSAEFVLLHRSATYCSLFN